MTRPKIRIRQFVLDQRRFMLQCIVLASLLIAQGGGLMLPRTRLGCLYSFSPLDRRKLSSGLFSIKVKDTPPNGVIAMEWEQKQHQQKQVKKGPEKLDEQLSLVNITTENTTFSQLNKEQLNGQPQNEKGSSLTIRNLWRKRNAHSIVEGIRREKTATQLSSILSGEKAENRNRRRYGARTITGLLTALAEEAEGLEVNVDARKDSPPWRKQVDSIKITFSRLGFKPLRLGGLNDAIDDWQASIPSSSKGTMVSNLMQSTRRWTSINEAFEKMDADNSGALDRDELAMALNMAASTPEDSASLRGLASELVDLYDTNGDGVVDFEEYQYMVEDMAALKREQESKLSGDVEEKPRVGVVRRIIGRARNLFSPLGKDEEEIDEVEQPEVLNLTEADPALAINTTTKTYDVTDDRVFNEFARGSGTIVLNDLKIDLSRLIFGAIPIVKKITPGGPLILEPFTATVIGSFNQDDILGSALLDSGLRRLVARALRIRVGRFRDFSDGAVFFGRTWNRASVTAPVVEVPELISVEFDRRDRLVLTGRARIQARPNTPVIEQGFKVRTKLGSGRNGRTIRLDQPELALVIECPRAWERNIASVYKKLQLRPPKRPDPIYSFFPVYSPFKLDDDAGFDLGPDNCIKSMFIKDGALRFELSAVLRPGRFLGNHYLAFGVPTRNFIITLDRVKAGIGAARRNKKVQRQQQRLSTALGLETRQPTTLDDDKSESVLEFARENPTTARKRRRGAKRSFFSRFVQGYLAAEGEPQSSERLTLAISDYFGSQSNSTDTSGGDETQAIEQ